jgi:hypothetical protein
MTTSRPLTLAAFALTTILTVSACSSNQTPPNDPSTASASPSSSEPSDSTVPSDWQSVVLDSVAEISVPSNWTIESTNDAIHTLKPPKGAAGFLPGWATVNVGNLAGGDQAEELEESANWAIETDYAGRNPKRLPDEVIDGTNFFRLQFESETEWYDVYGTVTPDAEHQIVFEWKFDKTIGREEAEAIWSPVMPTFKML